MGYFKKMIKLMRIDYNYYLLKRWGTYCSDCPENQCLLCVEEKKYLIELIDEKEE